MKRKFPSPCPSLLALALCLMAGAGCTKASKAKDLLVAADKDFQAQKYDQAESEYKSVLRLSPRDPVAIRQLGFIYFDDGRPRSAFPYLQESFKLDPTNVDVQLKLAEVDATRGDMTNGLMLLESVLRADPGNEHALALQAEISPSQEMARVGQRLETQIREGGPGAAACHSALGWIDLRMKKLGDAEAEFQKASELDAKLASPYLGKAALCSQRTNAAGVAQALKTAVELSPIRSSTRLKYAEYKLQIGAEEEAKAILSEISRQAPDYIPAWLLQMKLAFAEKKYDECRGAIATILSRDSLNFEALLQSAMLAEAESDAPKALSVLRRLDEVYNKVPEVKYYLARAYFMNNKTQDGEASLKEALALKRDYAPAVRLLADLDYRENKLSEAASLLAQEMKDHPEDAPAQMAMAEIYLARKEPERALAIYEEMERTFPKEPEIPRRMGLVYFRQGNHAKAHAAFEKSLAAKPDYLPALQNITELEIGEGHYIDAHARMARIMADYPKAAEPWTMQGDIYRTEGKTNDAENAYAKAIELNPEQSAAYLRLADFYIASKQEGQALERLNNLLAKQTNDVKTLVQTWMTIGEIHQAAGRYEHAREAYQKVLSLDSNSMPALNNLAYVESEYLGKVDDALELASRARTLRPYDPNAADTKGWILYKKREYELALNAIKEAAEKLPGDPEVQMHLGMVHYMRGEEQPARDHLQQALASPAEFPEKDLARRRLEVLDLDPSSATAEVAQKLQTMVKEDPTDPVPLSHLAAIEEQNGETQKAAASLQTLLKIVPTDWSAMIRLARLYADKLNEPRKAFELAKSAHSLSGDAKASGLLGELAFRSGDYPWALSLMQEAARQPSDQPTLYYNLALARYAMGRTAEADESMQKAVQQGGMPGKLDQAKQFLAMLEAVKGPAQAQAASGQVERILAKDPNDVPALMVSGLLAQRADAFNKAVQTYQKVLTIYPPFAPAMRELAILYSQHPGDLDKAYDFAQKARASLPDDLELTRVLGILAYDRGDYDKSIRWLKEYTDKSGEDGEAYYYLGMGYYKLNQTNLCRQALANALTLHVSKTLADNAQGILKQLK